MNNTLEVDDPRLWMENSLYPAEDPTKAFRLMPGQQVMLRPQLTRRIVRAHRRSGKTVSCVVLAIWFAEINPGSKILLLVPERFIHTSITKHLIMFLGNRVYTQLGNFGNLTTAFQLQNKSIIEVVALSATSPHVSAIRGKEVNLLIIDEGEMLNDNVWMALNSFIERDPSMKVFITVTPSQTKNYFEQYTLKESTSFEHIHFPITHNYEFDQAKRDNYQATCSSETSWLTEWMAESLPVNERH